MRVAVLISYVLIVILYLTISNDSRNWDGLYSINATFTIACLCSFCLMKTKIVGFERLLFKYVIFLSGSLSTYTIPCIWGSKDWVIDHTFYYAWFVGICFALTMGYGIYKYSDEL